jgi:hypothetical protein
VSVYPTGSRTPKVTTVIIRRGPNQALKSRVLPDDVVNGDLEAGANQVADSGKKMAVMRSSGIPGMHGINPGLGLPPGSAYSYTEKERSTARAACRDRPAAMPMRLLAGFGRWQQWAGAALVDGAGNAIQTYHPGLVANPIPAAAGFTGTVDTRIDGLTGSSHVDVHIFAGSSASGTAQVIVPLPFSPSYPSLRVEADVSADWLSYQNGGGGILCAGPLSTLDPADCGLGLLNAGAVAIELTYVQTVAQPLPAKEPKP